MSGTQPSIDLVPQLVHDIVALIRLRPGALLRLPTSPCWGLALTRLGNALWVAISIAGCARIAAQRRPWVHACAHPDLGRLAGLLAARFPHAEPREAPGSFLYALDEAAGPCGQAVLLAQASAERFPWLVAGTALPLAAAAVPAPVAEVEWPDHREGGPPGAQTQCDLISGGALPGTDDPHQFVAAVLARWDRSVILDDDGRSRLRAALLSACAQERQRLAVLRRAWPAAAADNPYGEPAWLAPASTGQLIEGALCRCAQPGGADAVAADLAALPAAESAAAMPLRRPLVVPTIRPAAALSSEHQPSGDEHAGGA